MHHSGRVRFEPRLSGLHFPEGHALFTVFDKGSERGESVKHQFVVQTVKLRQFELLVEGV